VTKFDKVIPPGSEGNIYASIDTSHSEGPIQKFIDIRSNDPAHPMLKVSIKAVIKSLVSVKPEYLRFNVMKGSLDSANVILTPQPSVKLLKPVVDSDLISAELTADKEGRQKLTVALKRTDIIGTHSVEVKVPAEGPIKEVSVPVVIIVRGPLTVNPSIVSFHVTSFPEVVQANTAIVLRQEPSVMSELIEKVSAGRQFQVLSESNGWYQVIALEKPAAGKAPQKTVPNKEIGWLQTNALKAVKPPESPGPVSVQIESSTGKSFLVLGLKSTLPAIQVKQKSGAQAGSSFEFIVSLQKVEGTQKQNQQGEIVVQTDNADQPQIRIPLYIMFS
jgi:Bacterial SH3 domain